MNAGKNATDILRKVREHIKNGIDLRVIVSFQEEMAIITVIRIDPMDTRKPRPLGRA